MRMYPNPNNASRAERERHEQTVGTRMYPDPNNTSREEREREAQWRSDSLKASGSYRAR